MALTTTQRLDRLKARTLELSFWRDRESMEVGGWTVDGKPIVPGALWPDRHGTHQFAARTEAPAHWPLDEIRLQLDLGGESLVTLLWSGGATTFGLDPFHQEFPVSARGFEIAAESVARFPFGEPNREPRFVRAQLIRLDRAVHDYHLLLRQIAEAVAVLGSHEVVPHLLEAAETSLRRLDWPSASRVYVARTASGEWQQKIWELPELMEAPQGLDQAQRQSVVTAHEGLVARLRELQAAYPPQGRLLLTGHAHIDLAWLWPYDETRRKMRRTFHSALKLIERSPDFRFNQSTAHYYAQVEEDDPALFDRIKAAVAGGQWETTGGMWVEPDTNMPAGESLVRQLLYGQRYFERTFGVRHTVCWLPDCFGFSPALPQLLVQAGITGFFTTKVNWSETNRIPADLFWWEGLDGSRVLAHTFDNPMVGYNGFVQPDCFVPTWANFKSKALHGTSLLAVGYGDGGGGVTPEMLEREVQLRDFPAIPSARWGRVEDYFSSVLNAAEEKRLTVWSGEIYLELHRATLTTQSAVKRLHRQAERALVTAEVVASLGHLLGAPRPASLESDWRLVLKNEFHDILPGSSIHEVYADAERELIGVIANARSIQAGALASIAALLPKGEIADALLVVNPSLDPRPLPGSSETVTPLSITVFDRARLRPVAGLSIAARKLENTHIAATIGEDGSVTSLVHKATGREALSAPMRLWVYPVDKPRNWDAWDIDEDYAVVGSPLDKPESIVLDGESIRVTYRYRDSSVTLTYRLDAHSRRLDVETHLDWHDRRTLLRVLAPANVRAARASFECAYGVIERPTHTNTSWDEAMFEAVAHRFVDLSEHGFGLALLNDAKYGHSARGNVLGLSLVRAPIYPDPFADEGEQQFTFALMPHAGGFAEGGVQQQADDLNQPLLILATKGLATGTLTPIALSGHPVALSALKPSEDDDGLILRVYEPAGGRGPLAIRLPAGWKVSSAVNLLEEPLPAETGISPFEVRSWRLSRS